ncbi:MAG TPA: hypothetical protein VJH22_00520 [Candidatus Nanoarchaeia archaeon]|nr:hypothetical protein [Candidatus Nanoarchaeia archaeon]
MRQKLRRQLALIVSACVGGCVYVVVVPFLHQYRENERLRTKIAAQNETIASVRSEYRGCIDAWQGRYDAANDSYDNLNQDYYTLRRRNDEQDLEYDAECARYDLLNKEYEELTFRRDELHDQYHALGAQYDSLAAVHSQCEPTIRACEATNAGLWQIIFRLERAREQQRRVERGPEHERHDE